MGDRRRTEAPTEAPTEARTEAPARRTVVVYVHGLWLEGWESFLLRRRLSRALDAHCCVFRYSSVGTGVADNAIALANYLAVIETETLHLVAHSLGGLVILKLFELSAPGGPLAGAAQRLPSGRIVLAGSPVRGSRSAERLARLPFGRALLGSSASDLLQRQREPHWAGGRDLGVIAGDLAVGLGRLMGPMGAAPNDGTVWLDETNLPGATQQLRVPVSHSGMVFSAEVARQVAAFLKSGRFEA